MRPLLWVLAALLASVFALPIIVCLTVALMSLLVFWIAGATLGTCHYLSMKLDTPSNNMTLKEAVSYGLYTVYVWGYNLSHRHKKKAPEYPHIFEVLRGF